MEYQYRPYVDEQPEVCDRPGCDQPATIETGSSSGTFLTCSLAHADRLH